MKLAPRIALFFGLLLLGGAAVTELAAWAAGQPPKRAEEEEEGDRKTPPGKRSEEEEPAPQVKRKVARPDEPGTSTKKPGEGIPADLDLKSAARRAKHIMVRRLFRELASPHDILTISRAGIAADRDQAILPIKQYIPDNDKLKGNVRMTFLENDGRPGKTYSLSPGAVRRVKPYEVLAGEAVDDFLSKHFEQPPYSLPVPDQLAAAELALSAVLRYHEAAREKETRVGEEWDKVRDGLRARLLEVVLRRLSLTIAEGNWDAAFARAKDVARRFPDPKDQAEIAKRTAVLVEKALDNIGEGKFKEVQRRLREFEEQFPGSKATEPVRKKLSDQARELLALAEKAKNNGQADKARQLIRQAEEIYPSLPRLRELRLEVEEDHPTLRVGVRELPLYLSPALAWTESERQAVELLFEGLVKLSPEPAGGRYRPALAQGRPQLIPLGREFTLPQRASWSDNRPITAADVQSTVQLLRSRDWEGRTPAWADDLFEDALVTDPFHVRLTLRRGYLVPLSLMDFKVLPSQVLQRPDNKEFAQKPISSGPFNYVGQASTRGRPYARFLANSSYSSRAGHTGLPRIQEIQFFETQDPVKDFKEGNIDLVLNLPSAKVKDMAAVPNVTVPAPLPSRRIYFLAVNHRHPALADAHLRRALALAINRQELLDKCFRVGLDAGVHRALNGPYPLGSWACDPSLNPKFLDDAGKAKAQLNQLKNKDVRLTLKYPSDDPQAAAAMEYLVKQVKNTLPSVDLNLRPVSSRKLHEEVEGDQDYELAYYWYDYPDQTYWLWPLLDPRSSRRGGRNYLGTRSGSKLEEKFREALGHRDFDRVRTTTHTIHRVFVLEEMPFIPLWQLDRFLAVHNDLRLHDGTRDVPLEARTPVPLDPLRLFSTVEYWRLRRK